MNMSGNLAEYEATWTRHNHQYDRQLSVKKCRSTGQKVREARAGQKQFGIGAEFSYLFLPTLSTSVPDSKNCNMQASKEHLPLRLAVEANGKVRHYRGIRDGAISNYSDYWIFEKNGKNAFDAFVVQEQESSSGSEDFDSEDIKSPFLFRAKLMLNQCQVKEKLNLDSLAVQKPEKKAKLPNAGTDSDGSNDWFRIMEEEVRHCFQRHPMSTTDLLANILKKLKPEQTRRKGTLHFTLLHVARIFHKFAAVSMNR
ncbi:General transcription factor IIF subunit [Trichinella spiralis]|uniref:General transcription factor IIF subunit n=1 Tax=Trichinella spiralis TaxID=6334 RepID=A0ABR3KTQ9_TRISP